MKFIETHAHIYSRKFAADRNKVIQDAIEAGIEQIYMPNIDLESIEGMLEVERDFPGVCFPMLGLHPCDVGEDFEKRLSQMEEWWGKKM